MGTLFWAWITAVVIAYYFYSKLKPLEALANWEKNLGHDPCCRSNILKNGTPIF